jgi:nucleoside-diphosphate-sugar epimerase
MRSPLSTGPQRRLTSTDVAGILVTGATGFVGSRLVRQLSGTHKVVALSRGEAQGAYATIRGDFASTADLAQLDSYQIDAVVHLAAETGGTSEESGLSVNVLGTRRLFRYLLDRGVKQFVAASSIAAVGCLSPEFVPRQLPIPADHPCDARDAYGLSKALVEEVCAYFQRIAPEISMTVLRLGVVVPESTPPVGDEALAQINLPFTGLATIAVQDVVDLLEGAIDLPPGFHRFNAVAPWMPTSLSVREALTALLGDRVDRLDLSAYDTAEHTSLYAIDDLLQVFARPLIDPRQTTPSTAANTG